MKMKNCDISNAATGSPAGNHITLAALGAMLTMLLLSGCVSVTPYGASDPDHYNDATGYPAVGGDPWRL